VVEPDKDAPGQYLDELASAAVEYFRTHPVPKDLPRCDEIERLKFDANQFAHFLLGQPRIQQRLAELVDYTPNRWLLTQEISEIRARRKIHKIHKRPDVEFSHADDPYEWARSTKLQGICFSGGGIRSATFNLGVLQGLAKMGALDHFDYLSSVSGGGYIHEWLAAWIKREEQEQQRLAPVATPPKTYTPGMGFREVQKRLVPLPSDKDSPAHPEPIRWLRRYSNYLTPQKGLFTADTWVAIAIWLRNTFLNQLILFSFLFSLLLIPNLAAQPITKATPVWSIFVAGILYLFAVLIMAIALRREYKRIRFLDKHPEAEQKAEEPKMFGGEWTVQILVVTPLLLASVLHLSFVLRLPDQVSTKGAYACELVFVSALLWLFVFAVAFAGASPETYMALHGLVKDATEIKKANGIKKAKAIWDLICRWIRILINGVGFLVLVNAAVSALAGTLLLVGVRGVLAWMATGLGCSEPWRLQVAFGPPLLFSVPLFTLVVGAGLVGRDFHDWLREWLARVRAWALLFGIGWGVFFGIALLGPYLAEWNATEYLRLTKTVKWAAVISWILTTAGSVLAGNSNKTGSKVGEPASRSVRLDILARVGPPVFVLGLLVLLSFAVKCAVGYVVSPHSWAMLILLSVAVKFGLGYVVSQHSGAMLILLAVLLAVVPLAIFLLFGWRVDVNEFSMNPFYRNRLTRCYLGASNRKRAPNPLTGFDDRDTRRMQISRLRSVPLPDSHPTTATSQPMDIYTGPFPIICATINLSFGEDLAWQERKAASFAFTPLYSGYHVGWTTGKHKHHVSFNGFVPTFHYAVPEGGINIATAVAISGAAASPNWGSHTNPATAFLMTVFNVRLGWWIFNPRRSQLAGATLAEVPKKVAWLSVGPTTWLSPRFAPLELAKELLGMADDTSKYVYLSDGGHFDNMGLYELVRRRCYRIVICDSEQDEDYFFEGIANAIRKCRVDFGVEITLDELDCLRPDPLTGNCKRHWARGKIRYPETPADQPGQESNEGKILYIKSSLTGAAKYEDIELPSEPADVVNFKFTHKHFPHDTTANQWFTESQFESYRRLGYHVIDEIQRSGQWEQFC